MHKNIFVFLVAALIIFGSCKSSYLKSSSQKNEVVVEQAIEVKSISEEYEYIKENCDGCQIMQQSLILIKKRPYDVLEVLKPNGDKAEYYFDISNFYGTR